MIFNSYSHVKDKHATLSPSNPAWLNYNEDALARSYYNNRAAERGTKLHAFAKEAIELGLRLRDDGTTVSTYVNDCIGFRMTPEQVLFVDEWAFGTADAICFRDNRLRIFDLKTGIIEASMAQLKIYAAYFCLNYTKNPFEIDEIDLRIYQNDNIKVEQADPDEVFHIMQHTLACTKFYRQLEREEAGL